jgi:thymidine phosphorylase
VIDDYALMPAAPDRHLVLAPRSGYVASLRAESVGRAAVALGAGRATLEDVIDPGVGIEVLLPPGAPVEAGDSVLLLHHRGGRGLGEALHLLDSAVEVSEVPRALQPLIVERIS